MLSNKWTFSLTSLVVILALAFVAPSAMAGEFSVDLSVVTAADNFANPDVSGDGGNQVEYGATPTFIRISTGGVVQADTTTAFADTAAARTAARALTTLEAQRFSSYRIQPFWWCRNG